MLRASRHLLAAVAAVCGAIACNVSLENKGPGTAARLSVGLPVPTATTLWKGVCRRAHVTLVGLRAGAAPVEVALTAPSGVSLFTDAACKTAGTTLTFATNDVQAFFLKATSGSGALDVTASASGLAAATLALTLVQPTASLVVGQADFLGLDPNGGGVAGVTTLSGATSADSDGTRLVVADTANHRVLLWNTLPTSSGVGADLVLGQTDFTSTSANQGGPASELTLNGPTQAILHGNRLIVVDAGNHRVLVWTSLPTVAGQAADLVLGQATFGGDQPNDPALGASTLNAPYDVTTDGTTLVVSDTGNHRVLLWPTFPVANGAAATYVLGQPDLTTNTTLHPSGAGTARNFSSPRGVVFTRTGLAVADDAANRVLVYGTVPASTNPDATAVLGQASATGILANVGGRTAATMDAPRSAGQFDDLFFVADSGNQRVLVYNGVPATTGTAADGVIGATLFTGGAIGDGATGFSTAGSFGFDGTAIWIPVLDQSRVLRFPLP